MLTPAYFTPAASTVCVKLNARTELASRPLENMVQEDRLLENECGSEC